MQLMVMKYDTSVAMAPKEVMALRATEEPMLMQERSALTASEIMTAGNGIFHPGET